MPDNQEVFDGFTFFFMSKKQTVLPTQRYTTVSPSRFTLPTGQTRGLMRDRAGWVAQLVEQRTENPCVGGSIPPPATTSNCECSKGLRGLGVQTDTKTDTKFGAQREFGVTGDNPPVTR